jgi:hypothetical protein
MYSIMGWPLLSLKKKLDNIFFLVNLNCIISDLLQHYFKMFNKIQVFIGNMNVVFLKTMKLIFKLKHGYQSLVTTCMLP